MARCSALGRQRLRGGPRHSPAHRVGFAADRQRCENRLAPKTCLAGRVSRPEETGEPPQAHLDLGRVSAMLSTTSIVQSIHSDHSTCFPAECQAHTRLGILLTHQRRPVTAHLCNQHPGETLLGAQRAASVRGLPAGDLPAVTGKPPARCPALGGLRPPAGASAIMSTCGRLRSALPELLSAGQTLVEPDEGCQAPLGGRSLSWPGAWQP